ncbi:MAG: hypothetical protein GTO18_00065 [Anaerolineales bacterium]|nr:hypothetical protein [Anaerolineales bacterium]
MNILKEIEEARKAASQGNRKKARSILRKIDKQYPKNEEVYILFAQVAEKPEHAIYCLQEVLKLNPKNQSAKHHLRRLIENNDLDAIESELQPLKVIQHKGKYIVEGDNPGWLSNEVFSRRWRANLAIKVYKNGGSISEYNKAVRRTNKLRGHKVTIARRGKNYLVEGEASGWIFDTSFPKRWMAKLALDFYKEGGEFDKFIQVAEDTAQQRNLKYHAPGKVSKNIWEKKIRYSRGTLSAVRVMKIVCPKCGYKEIPATHRSCRLYKEKVIGRWIEEENIWVCESCGGTVKPKYFHNRLCQKCGNKAKKELEVVNLAL